MKMFIENKTALVTGSTKGIGKAIATEMAKEGARVVINGRSQDVVDKTVSEIVETTGNKNVSGIAVDLSSETDRQKLYKEIPTLDILVNNMGIFGAMQYKDVTDEVWEKYFQINFLSGNALAQHYLPNMLKNDFGRIIFIASEEAIMPSGEQPQYAVTKTMNLSLARSISKETIGTHVTVNTVMPGSTLTEGVETLIDDLYKDSGFSKEEAQASFMKDHRPLSQIQRLIKPEEIGRLVTFVASPLASSFSGAAIRMDGGMVPTIF